MITIKVEKLFHRKQQRLALRFPKNEPLMRVVKAMPDARFSFTHKCWYVDDTPNRLQDLFSVFKDKADLDVSALRKEKPKASTEPGNAAHDRKPMVASKALRAGQLQARAQVEQKLKLKGYSASTLKTYLEQFTLFMKFFTDSHPADLGEDEIQMYLMYLIDKKKLSKSTQNQAINAIKFYFEKVLKQEKKVYHLERPLKEKKLPEILSQQEVMALFEAAGNLKHRVMLMVIYSAGLRRSELLALRTGDVDLDRHQVFIRGAKGHKDRQSVLAASLIPLLRQYLEEYQPSFWLFEGQRGQRYSETSLQAVIKQAAERAGIRKNVHLHMLRHSFATHLLEGGTSTRYIQVLLGHESPKTTEIYAQVTRFGLDKVISPLDHIAQSKKLRGDE
jgi:integrase/recombinase XerD